MTTATASASASSAAPVSFVGEARDVAASFASVTTGRAAVIAGRMLTAVPALFLAWDAAMKIVLHPMVVEASPKVGLPVEIAQPIGIVLALCTVLFVVPRTALVGAVLLTGYLGGAVLVHLRIGDPLLTHTLFPVYVGAFIWGGLLLRDPRARLLIARR